MNKKLFVTLLALCCTSIILGSDSDSYSDSVVDSVVDSDTHSVSSRSSTKSTPEVGQPVTEEDVDSILAQAKAQGYNPTPHTFSYQTSLDITKRADNTPRTADITLRAFTRSWPDFLNGSFFTRSAALDHARKQLHTEMSKDSRYLNRINAGKWQILYSLENMMQTLPRDEQNNGRRVSIIDEAQALDNNTRGVNYTLSCPESKYSNISKYTFPFHFNPFLDVTKNEDGKLVYQGAKEEEKDAIDLINAIPQAREKARLQSKYTHAGAFLATAFPLVLKCVGKHERAKNAAIIAGVAGLAAWGYKWWNNSNELAKVENARNVVSQMSTMSIRDCYGLFDKIEADRIKTEALSEPKFVGNPETH